MIASESAARDLQWLMRSFATEIPGVVRVVLVSSDGLLLGVAENPDRLGRPAGSAPGAGGDPQPDKGAQQLAAILSGLVSLATGGGRLLGKGRVRQTIVTMSRGSVVAMPVSDGSCLGVQAASDSDLAVIAYQMTAFVGRAEHVLTPELRAELHRAVSHR